MNFRAFGLNHKIHNILKHAIHLQLSKIFIELYIQINKNIRSFHKTKKVIMLSLS
jgi:hypothetical protein